MRSIPSTIYLILASSLLEQGCNAANVFNISPSASQLDTSSFPALDRLAPINPAHMSMYDFSKVPNITVNTPYNNTGPANCSASDPRFGDGGSCTWSCGNCVRPATDTVTCYQKNQWGLSFDDGMCCCCVFSA